MATGSGSRGRRAATVPPRRRGRGPWLWALWLGLMVWLGFEYARLPDVSSLAKERPGPTGMMRERERELAEAGRKARVRQHWVELKRIAPHAVNAVLVSEDARFYQHGGFDWFELQASLDQALEKKRLPRGASTITQQVARNLYYGSEWSLLRKAREALVAVRLERALDKHRILTIYLNIAEWGDGVWGIEAAARTHFGVSASRLSVAQGAMLAAMLPAPRAWTPRSRPTLIKRRAARLVGRLERTGRISAAQAAAARVELGLGRRAAPAIDDEVDQREEREEREQLEALNAAAATGSRVQGERSPTTPVAQPGAEGSHVEGAVDPVHSGAASGPPPDPTGDAGAPVEKAADTPAAGPVEPGAAQDPDLNAPSDPGTPPVPGTSSTGL